MGQDNASYEINITIMRPPQVLMCYLKNMLIAFSKIICLLSILNHVNVVLRPVLGCSGAYFSRIDVQGRDLILSPI